MTTSEFMAQMPKNELLFLKDQPKYIRDKYYSYISSALKRGHLDAKMPRQWLAERRCDLMSYAEIGKRLGIDKKTAQKICEVAIKKIEFLIKSNPKMQDFI